MADEMTNVMQVTGLSLCRAEKALLSNLDFSLQAGQITVVLGPNGAGKSTLLLALAGLLNIEQGDILLQNRPLFDFSRQALTAQIAWQGELPPTEFGLSVKQRLQLASTAGSTADIQIADIQTASVSMAVSGLLHRCLGDLSDGERQRVELAALMLRDVPLWLLDEPTAHLDLKHQRQCLFMLKAQAEQGRSIVTVLHDIQQAQALADQLILIDGKGAAVCGTAARLLTSERLSELFDTPLLRQGSNLIPDYGGDGESTQ